MWVKDPTSNNPACFSIEFLAKIKKKLGRRGKNVHLLVLNMTENLFAVRSLADANSNTALCNSAEVASPAQVLPVGTAVTVRNRWKGWSAMTVGGVGNKLCVGYPDLKTYAAGNLSWFRIGRCSAFARVGVGVAICDWICFSTK